MFLKRFNGKFLNLGVSLWLYNFRLSHFGIKVFENNCFNYLRIFFLFGHIQREKIKF